MEHPDPGVQESRQFPKLSLGGLFLFGMYLREALQLKWSDGMSFRAFVKSFDADRSHRVLVKMTDRIEYQSQRLLIYREYKDSQGYKCLTDDIEDTRTFRCKRNGTITRYGEAWCEMIEHIADLYDLAVESEDDTELLKVITAQRKQLSPVKEAAKKKATEMRLARNFDKL